MNCYLCSESDFIEREGSVRDSDELKVLECKSCGLVTLSSFDHISESHYQQSGMHADNPQTIESWLNQTSEDDDRRFDCLRGELPNKKLLDFGSGNGGFLQRAKNLANGVVGVELEERVRAYWKEQIKILPDIESISENFDLITAFHVIEHLPDPRKTLLELSKHLAPGGVIVAEVPNSEDALLTLYQSPDFQKFTYWSQHLYLFNAPTLERLASQAGLKVVATKQFQRYPLANHLYWLSRGQPGGHCKWDFLDTPLLREAYSQALASIGKCDTLLIWMSLE